MDAEFYTTTRMEYRMFAKGQDEAPVIEHFLDNLSAEDVVYDIGANLGKYACLAGRAGADVVAFEPTAVVADRLAKNAQLNDVDVSIHRVALGEEDGEVELPVNLNWNDEPTTARLVRGDDFVEAESIPVPDVVKIDVDGGELGVVRGLSETLSHPDCRLLYCEVHPEMLADRGIDAEEVHDALHSAGFDLERIYDRDAEYYLCCRK
jgi:FkbM family methyltransferase